ncbi:sulfatase, partial [candidate division MSBL1 archaeon SCGC-AAA259O05]
YGYHRDTSPDIDKIADQGVRFSNYYCSDAPCLPSRTALVTGQFGIHNGVVGHGGTNADIRIEGEKRGFRSKLSRESLPGFLNSIGLKTVSISPFAERHGSWSFYAGFDEIHNTGKCGMESAEDVTPLALDWIEKNAGEDDWFLHVNYWDSHTPYRAPEEFGNPFEDEPIPDWFDEEILKEHRQHVGPHSARELGMYDNQVGDYPRMPGEIEDMSDLKKLIDGYDCGVKYMDRHIGRLLSHLEEKGIMEDLAIIISADHGENIGELGIYSEHATADHAACRIPMIIKWPGCEKGKVDTGLHYNLDLAPTLADILDESPPDRWDGRSYAPAIFEGDECGRDYLVLSQCAHVCQRSVRFKNWLYMRTYHDGFHLFPKEMLYDLSEDPHERFNVAEENPDVCKEGISYLTEWHDEMMETMPDGYTTDPLWRVMEEGGPYHAKGNLKDYCDRLRKTGREDAISELKKKHPEEF